ncbi:MAG: hypothetical protein KAI47_00845, partial [Deltaproteobacteria bacterium]|nr:hypothetical protein [Deltaproteobacteria bacterium]
MRNARPVIRAFTRRTVAIRALFLLFFVSIALFAPKVQAKAFSVWGRDFDLRVTTTLRYDYRADNQNGPNVLVFPGSPPRPYNDFDDEYHYIFHTMDLQLSTGRLRIGTRLDLNLFLDTPLAGCAQAGSNRPAACGHRYLNQLYLARQDRKIPGGDEPYHFAGPERMFLTYADDAWDVTLGDFTASFGAGIALLATKISDVGQDHAVRGGKLRIHKGPVEATLLAGTFNFLDTDVFTGVASRTIWAEEPLFGASFRYTLGDRFLRLGSHVVHVLRDAPLNGGDPYDTVWGLTAALPNLLDGDLSISTEVDFQRTFNGSCVSRGPDRDCDGIAHGDTHPFHGVASYAHASLSRGNWTFTGEAKYFNDFKLNGSQSPIEAYQLTYSQAPTLERAYAIPTETANTGGARIRTDYNFEEIFKGLFELLV